MKLLKQFTAGALALTLALTAAPGTAAADVAADSAAAVSALTGLGVLQGRTEDGDLALEQDVTRAEAATILYRIVTGDVTGSGLSAPARDPFTDVSRGDWHAAAVSWCAQRGLIGGHGNGAFGPNDPVTGHQLTAMLLRALNYDDGDAFTGDDWQEGAAGLAALTGLTDGEDAAALTGPAGRDLTARLTWQAVSRTPLARDDGSNAATGVTLGYQTFGVAHSVPLKAGDVFWLLDVIPRQHLSARDTHLALLDGRVVTVDLTVGLAAAAESAGGMGGKTGPWRVDGLRNGLAASVSPLPRARHTGLTWTAPGVMSAVDEDGNSVYLTLADGCQVFVIDGASVTSLPVEEVSGAEGWVAQRDQRGYAAVLWLVK